MNPYTLIAPIAGVLAAVGIAMLIWWIRGLQPHPDRARNRRSRVLESGVATMRRQRVIRLGIAVAAGLGTWVITGWPVGGVAAGCAAFFLPSFFTVGRQMERRIERLEALEEWVRRLADSMAVGSAPIATIVRSAARAPEAIRPEVSELAQRLGTARWDRSVALRQFADRIDDSLGDLIALALEIAVSARASERVPGVLRQMADAAAEEVKARRQIEVERAAPRNEARILVLFNVAVMVVVAVFTDYTAPYNGPLGQAFLAILMLLLTGCIWLLRKYSLGEATPRILTSRGWCPCRWDGGDPVMSSLWMVALVAGAAVGLGVGVLVYLVAVPQRPALGAADEAGRVPPPTRAVHRDPRSRSLAAAPAAHLLAKVTQVGGRRLADLTGRRPGRDREDPPAIPAGTGGTDSDRALHSSDLGGDDVGIGCRIAVGHSAVGQRRAGGGVLVPGDQPGAGRRSGTPP